MVMISRLDAKERSEMQIKIGLSLEKEAFLNM